jgi:hypothetical protein
LLVCAALVCSVSASHWVGINVSVLVTAPGVFTLTQKNSTVWGPEEAAWGRYDNTFLKVGWDRLELHVSFVFLFM